MLRLQVGLLKRRVWILDILDLGVGYDGEGGFQDIPSDHSEVRLWVSGMALSQHG